MKNEKTKGRDSDVKTIFGNSLDKYFEAQCNLLWKNGFLAGQIYEVGKCTEIIKKKNQ